MQFTKHSKTVLAMASVALLVACQSKPIEPEVKKEEPVVQQTVQQPVDTNKVQQVATPTYDLAKDEAKRSVFFDFDSYAVKDQYAGLIGDHAKNLNANKGKNVLIQGNADERGGREYNLALGQKRAEAVRKSLTLQGAADSQIEAVSLGKEKPVALGHDEDSWAKNRRADITYK